MHVWSICFAQAFVTHFGKCIDEKTPLLRSMDAVKTSGLRMLKAIGIGTDAQTMHSYLGWEQESAAKSSGTSHVFVNGLPCLLLAARFCAQVLRFVCRSLQGPARPGELRKDRSDLTVAVGGSMLWSDRFGPFWNGTTIAGLSLASCQLVISRETCALSYHVLSRWAPVAVATHYRFFDHVLVENVFLAAESEYQKETLLQTLFFVPPLCFFFFWFSEL